MGSSVSSTTATLHDDSEMASRRGRGATGKWVPTAGTYATLPNRGRTAIDEDDEAPDYYRPYHCHSTLGNRGHKNRHDAASSTKKTTADGPETSRVLFLLYLIHRTWNVVVDTVDPKSKRSRSSQSSTTASDRRSNRKYSDEYGLDVDLDDEDDDADCDSLGSQYTGCSCSYCNGGPKRNPLFGQPELRMSFCESELSCSTGVQMAPRAGKTPPGTQKMLSNMTAGSGSDLGVGSDSHGVQQTIKENERPPVYNAEDYVAALKNYSRRTNSGSTTNHRSIYDTNDEVAQPTVSQPSTKDNKKTSTLPSKNADYKSPIQSPPEHQYEMSLRQFGSITDLLSKLRADLRASFPSFVQEFVAAPMDGTSLLLDVLRAIQLSQSNNTSGTHTLSPSHRNNQTYQRRALLDELACLQCMNLCTSRCADAGIRLGTSVVGLLPLAASATGQGIRSRILALQLMTTACDRATYGHMGNVAHGFDGSSLTPVLPGHTSVSEALSTLRLRCGEPVRFRLLVGMLNSGGGSGELQMFGMKFINTFLNNAENSQQRLYLQAELSQAGLDPETLDKTINESSPWLEKLRMEVKVFSNNKINVEQLIVQNREAERIRSQMVILERRVQILQEEKTVLTSMERRLQERCADLQRQVFRLQGTQPQNSTTSDTSKRPVALPRHVPPQHHTSKTHSSSKTQASSEQEDEGISSSETGQSLSPEPILVLPFNNTQKYRITVPSEENTTINNSKEDDDSNAVSIDEVIEELANIVSEAERQICINEVMASSKNKPNSDDAIDRMEKDIVPVNLLPQPPRKSRSLVHMMSQGESDFGGSDYGLVLGGKADDEMGKPTSYYEEPDYDQYKFTRAPIDDSYSFENPDILNQSSTNRDILNVIMDAREKDADLKGLQTMPPPHPITSSDMLSATQNEQASKVIGHDLIPVDPPNPQKFSGVFFMTQMSTPQRYPKPDITAALEARRVTKNLDRIESYGGGLDTMIDIVMTETAQKQLARKQHQQHQHPTPVGNHMLLTGSSMTRIPFHHNPAPVKHCGQQTTASGAVVVGSSKLTDLPSGLY